MLILRRQAIPDAVAARELHRFEHVHVLRVAEAALHQAEVNLGYTDIRSPINGVVISRSVDVGQTVAASLQAPTIFTIAEDLSNIQITTYVAESDIGCALGAARLASAWVARRTVHQPIVDALAHT